MSFSKRLQEALDNIWIDPEMKPRHKDRDETGFTDQFHGFDEKSLKGYTSTKFLSTLSEKLSRLTKWSINLFISDEHPSYGQPGMKELSRRSGLPPERMANSINFVLGGEGGLLRVSPWLILHQLGEAIVVYDDRELDFMDAIAFARKSFPETWYIDLFKRLYKLF